MSVSMIERVARAIYTATEPKKGWDSRSDDYKVDYFDYARAAIEAMRQPTDEMVNSCGNGECSRWATGAWKNYIDAALKD